MLQINESFEAKPMHFLKWLRKWCDSCRHCYYTLWSHYICEFKRNSSSNTDPYSHFGMHKQWWTFNYACLHQRNLLTAAQQDVRLMKFLWSPCSIHKSYTLYFWVCVIFSFTFLVSVEVFLFHFTINAKLAWPTFCVLSPNVFS